MNEAKLFDDSEYFEVVNEEPLIRKTRYPFFALVNGQKFAVSMVDGELRVERV